ncbi:MAG: ABC transporter permease [Zestosphaera sp.]
MRLQRVKALAGKEVKKMFREPAVVFMIIMFPIVFVTAFGISFGGARATQPSYAVGVVLTGRDYNSTTYMHQLVDAFSATGVLRLQKYPDVWTAQDDLIQGRIQAVIVIPENIEASLTTYRSDPENPGRWVNTTILLYLDKGSVIAMQIIPAVLEQTISVFMGVSRSCFTTPIKVEVSSLVEVTQSMSLEFIAPGMFTFASIFLIMMVAQSLTQDRESGMLDRIMSTPTTPAEFMTSYVLAYAVVALIQAVLLFTAMYFMGFRPSVGIPTYLLAFTMVLIFSLSNVGFGLIAASISKNPSTSTGVSFIFITPQLFLGTFVVFSISPVAKLAGAFIPSYYVTDALTTLFLREAPPTSPTVLLDLLAVGASSVIILLAGILLHRRYYS